MHIHAEWQAKTLMRERVYRCTTNCGQRRRVQVCPRDRMHRVFQGQTKTRRPVRVNDMVMVAVALEWELALHVQSNEVVGLGDVYAQRTPGVTAALRNAVRLACGLGHLDGVVLPQQRSRHYGLVLGIHNIVCATQLTPEAQRNGRYLTVKHFPKKPLTVGGVNIRAKKFASRDIPSVAVPLEGVLQTGVQYCNGVVFRHAKTRLQQESTVPLSLPLSLLACSQVPAASALRFRSFVSQGCYGIA